MNRVELTAEERGVPLACLAKESHVARVSIGIDIDAAFDIFQGVVRKAELLLALIAEPLRKSPYVYRRRFVADSKYPGHEQSLLNG